MLATTTSPSKIDHFLLENIVSSISFSGFG